MEDLAELSVDELLDIVSMDESQATEFDYASKSSLV